MIAIAAILANIIWGTPFKLIKVMNTEMGISRELLGDRYIGQVLAIISLRFFIAGVMTLIFAKMTKQEILKISKTQWKEVAIMGLLSTILAQSTIFFAVILAHFFYKNDRLTSAKILGLIVGFIGLIVSQLTSGTQLSDMFSFSMTGEGFMLMYGLLAAVATMLAKKNWVFFKLFCYDRMEFNYWFSCVIFDWVIYGRKFSTCKLEHNWNCAISDFSSCFCYSI